MTTTKVLKNINKLLHNKKNSNRNRNKIGYWDRLTWLVDGKQLK